MSVRDNLLALAWAVSACWLAGCAHTVAVMPEDPASAQAPARTALASTKRPDILQSASADRPPTGSPFGISQVKSGQPAPEPVRSPPPAPLSEAPGPTRNTANALQSCDPPVQAKPSIPEDPPLVAALRCYFNQQPAEAVALLERYDKPNQELLLTLLPLAVRLSEKNVPQLSAQEAGLLLAQLQGIVQPLRTRADLVVSKLCFCKEIKNFGEYVPLPDNHAFHPGERVYVYVEVQNFASEPQGKHSVTRLASALEIRKYNNGDRRWREEFPKSDEADVSLSARTDLFRTCSFSIPENLLPGDYTLHVEIKDVLTNRVAKRTLDFRVSNLPVRAS